MKIKKIEKRLVDQGAPPILTRKELEKHLPFARPTLAKMLANGELPAQKLRSRWAMWRTDLARWLAENMR